MRFLLERDYLIIECDFRDVSKFGNCWLRSSEFWVCIEVERAVVRYLMGPVDDRSKVYPFQLWVNTLNKSRNMEFHTDQQKVQIFLTEYDRVAGYIRRGGQEVYHAMEGPL
jgi:hypothetical protein